MLDDIRVLEASDSLATAFCGKFLVDVGATVLKAEPGPAGVVLRTTEPTFAAYLHGGKESLLVEDVASIADLVAGVDLVLLDRADTELVAAVEQVKAVHPGLSIVYVSDHGLPAGVMPPSNLFTVEAESGMMSLRDTGGLPPVASSADLTEAVAGLCAALAVVTIVLDRDLHGGGVDAEVSRLEALIALRGYPWLPPQIEGHAPDPLPNKFLSTVLPASDGWVCVIFGSHLHWTMFVAVADMPELLDERFTTLQQRFALADEIAELLGRFTISRTTAELLQMADEHRLTITPVAEPVDVPSSVPFSDRGAFVTHEVDGLTFTQPAPPHRIDSVPAWEPRPLQPAGAGDTSSADWSPAEAAIRTSPPRPLEGVRVLQFGLFQAGPLTSSYLTYLGADVIKVESASRPDPIRFANMDPTLDRFWDRQSLYNMTNLGARGVTANFSDPRGLEIFRRLLAEADVVLDNYSPRVLEKVGLDPAGMRELNPDLLIVRMPAWSLASPWREKPGFTFTADATSGFAVMTGYPDDKPVLSGSALDPVSSFSTAFATLVALRHQRRTGTTSVVQVPLSDVAAPITARAIISASIGGSPVRTGNAAPGVFLQDVFLAADGSWVAVTVPTEADWTALAEGPLGEGDPRETVAAYVEARSTDDAVKIFVEAGIAAVRVALGPEVIGHPALAARRRVHTISHVLNGDVDFIGWPMAFSSESAMSMPGPAPLLGQHNAEVLGELGYSAEEIAALAADDVIGDHFIR